MTENLTIPTQASLDAQLEALALALKSYVDNKETEALNVFIRGILTKNFTDGTDWTETPEHLSNAILYAYNRLTELVCDHPTALPTGTLRQHSSLRRVVITSLTSAGSNFCDSCSHLTEVSLPSLTSAGNNFCSSCSNLTEVSLPSLTSAGSNFCYSCSNLTKLTLGSFCATVQNSLTSRKIEDLTLVGNLRLEGQAPKVRGNQNTVNWCFDAAHYNDPEFMARVNKNIRDHIAPNLLDTTAGSEWASEHYTITFHKETYNRLEEATVAAIVAKGWTVASS